MIPTLYKGNVTLRPLACGDLPDTLRWRNRDDVRRWFIYNDMITPEQHQAWYEAYQQREQANTDYTWVIAANGVPCGQVSLYDIQDGRAEFGRMMIGQPELRGTGTGRTACQMVTEYGLGKLGLEYLFLRVIAANRRAIQVYLDCGYQYLRRENDIIFMRYIL